MPMKAGSLKALPFEPMAFVEADWNASELVADQRSACGAMGLKLDTC